MEHEKVEPETETVAAASRVVHAAIAFIVTLGVASLVGLSHEPATEVALLNGGLALYTAEASGRIASALNRLTAKIGKGV